MVSLLASPPVFERLKSKLLPLPHPAQRGFWCSFLSVMPLEQAPQRQVFVELRPMQPEWRNLDVRQLKMRTSLQARAIADREVNHLSAIHLDHDLTLVVMRLLRCINQSIHATCG